MTSSGHGRGMFVGVLWLTGTQVLTFGVQFFYAGLTSRLVSPAEFGAYGVGLIVIGGANLLASAGIAQAVMRLRADEVESTRALSSVALMLGALVALIVLVTADLWASAWGISGADDPIRLLAISCFVSPQMGVAMGVVRREGRFRFLAVIQLISAFTGMGFGAFLVFTFRNSTSLVAFSVIQQSLVLILLGSSCWKVIRPGPIDRTSIASLTFSARVLLSNLREFALLNGPKVAVSRTLGAAALGGWARAEVLTVQPFTMVQTSILQVVYPQFAKDAGSPVRRSREWSDLLSLVAWVTIPFGAIGAVMLPPLVPYFFGPGWEATAALLPAVAIAASLQPLTTLLSSALEARGLFRSIFRVQLVLVLLMLLTCGVIVVTKSVELAVILAIANSIARHTMHLIVCRREALVDLKILLYQYVLVICFSISVGGLLFIVQRLLLMYAGRLPSLVGTTAFLAVLALVALCARRYWAPTAIAKRYRLIGAGV